MTRAELLAEMERQFGGRQGRRRGMHVHDLAQASLRSSVPWPVKHRADDVASRLVAHLELALEDPERPIERLVEAWKSFMGIQTCADAYTTKLRRGLPADVRTRLEREGVTPGDPIYALPPDRAQRALVE